MVTNRDSKSITRFRPWSPIATVNHLDRAEKKIAKVAQTTGTVDVFDPRSGISGLPSWRASACPYLHEWWTQPAHVRCPVIDLAEIRWSSKISSRIWSITLVNTQNVSVTNIADSSSTQRAETKYGLRIQFLALVVMIHEVWLNA